MRLKRWEGDGPSYPAEIGRGGEFLFIQSSSPDESHRVRINLKEPQLRGRGNSFPTWPKSNGQNCQTQIQTLFQLLQEIHKCAASLLLTV